MKFYIIKIKYISNNREYLKIDIYHLNNHLKALISQNFIKKVSLLIFEKDIKIRSCKVCNDDFIYLTEKCQCNKQKLIL